MAVKVIQDQNKKPKKTSTYDTCKIYEANVW